MYDFILFENAHSLENHYKDLYNLAVLLEQCGYKVAIANVFKEKTLDVANGKFEYVDLAIKCPKVLSKRKNAKRSTLFNLHLRILAGLYLVYVIRALRKKAKNFYIGTLTLSTPIMWLFLLPSSNKYFIWGLRTHFLEVWKTLNFGLSKFYSKWLCNAIQRKNNIIVIVSHDIIKSEFLNSIILPEQRIVVRPERFIENVSLSIDSATPDKLKLLTIGTLRKSKHVELVLDALRIINSEDILYTIAGRTKGDAAYENMINERSQGVRNVERLNGFIDENLYNKLLAECDFLVLCDEKESSCGTNGTMAEALLGGKPIIAPNHNPFKYEIEKYNIGFLYNDGDVNSLVDIIKQAKISDATQFREGLTRYQNDHCISNVTNSLKKQLTYVFNI